MSAPDLTNDVRRQIARNPPKLRGVLHLAMIRRGIMAASRLMYCVSTAMGEAEVDTAIGALNESLRELRPYIEAERPELIAGAS